MGPETPLGRTVSESAAACLQALSANAERSAQRRRVRLRHIMAEKLETKLSRAQASRTCSAGTPMIFARAQLVRFHSLPVHQRRRFCRHCLDAARPTAGNL